MKQRLLQLILAAGMLLGLGGPARADLIYDLNLGNSDISSYTGPYGSVVLHLDTLTHQATLTFTANSGYRFGDGGFVDANFNSAGFTGFVSCAGDVGGGTGFVSGPCTNGGSGTVDGFGVFSQTTTNFDGFKSSAISAVLVVNGTWANENDVLAANSAGNFVAAHIFVCTPVGDTGCDQGTDALATGYAASNREGSGDIPEPQSLALVGLGLVGLAMVRRRRNS